MSTVALKRVGSLDLTDLIGMCSDHGDGVPYPLWRTQRKHYWGEIAKGLPPFRDRFVDDLSPFREWTQTYEHADIWVDCRVNAFTASTPEIRILAHRADQAGFLASQRPDADVIDIFKLSPLDLGAAVAGSVGLERPGSRQSIVIPGLLDNFIGNVAKVNGAPTHDFAEDDGYSVSLRVNARPRTRSTTLNENDVVFLGTVQSRCQAKDVWAVDWTRDAVVWVRIDGDGDYVYAPDYSHAVPVRSQTLSKRIDQLIATDVAILRRQRGLT